MLEQILRLLLTTAVDIYTLIVMLRLLLQLVKADFYNPISQFVVKASDPPLKPLRRIIPGYWGIDFASLTLALLVQIVGWIFIFLLDGAVVSNPLLYLLLGLFGVLKVTLNLYFFAIIILIILSWVAPGTYNPAAALLSQITEPVMAPFRRLLPAMGGLDFSPMLALMVIFILRDIVVPGLLTSMAGSL